MAITFDTIANGELAEKFQMALTQIGATSWILTRIRKPSGE